MSSDDEFLVFRVVLPIVVIVVVVAVVTTTLCCRRKRLARDRIRRRQHAQSVIETVSALTAGETSPPREFTFNPPPYSECANNQDLYPRPRYETISSIDSKDLGLPPSYASIINMDTLNADSSQETSPDTPQYMPNSSYSRNNHEPTDTHAHEHGSLCSVVSGSDASENYDSGDEVTGEDMSRDISVDNAVTVSDISQDSSDTVEQSTQQYDNPAFESDSESSSGDD